MSRARRILRTAGVAVAGFAVAQCASVGRKLTIAYGAVTAQLAADEVKIELDRSFIEAYKNRVTIQARFTVDASAGSPNPAIFDGDYHFAGRAPEIGLRLVAEILNGADADSAVALVKRAEEAKQPLVMTGAWRLWPEHALGTPQEQGRPVAPLRNANPDHVFEINPITRLGPIDLRSTIHTVEGYRPGSAERTFEIYQAAKCSLAVSPEKVTMTVSTGLYNDVHFLMRPTADRHLVARDGRFVTADALDAGGKVLVERLRMVFIAGSGPERAVRGLATGARLHVWGKPRVDFAELSRRVQASAANPALLKGRLPYEIVVLGTYPDERKTQ
ncbi:MAG: hypothetical protein ACRENB_02400 [Gemmatimonadales bacterium]